MSLQIYPFQHNSTSFLPKVTFKEFVGCTSKQIPIEKLGKVGYLCRGLPIYELKTLKAPVQSTSSQNRKKYIVNQCKIFIVKLVISLV